MNKPIWKIITALLVVFTLLIQSDASAASQSEATISSIQLSQNWLERFNYYRQAAGLPSVIESPAYSADLAKHVTYMLLNVPTEGLWHGETPGHP